MSDAETRLIYDIGANDGSDTLFYLSKGFKVVAVEADPDLSDDIKTNMRSYIESGALVALGVGVGDTNGALNFNRNEFREWSSFKSDNKSTQALSHTVISVPMVKLSDLIAKHGAPYYIKLDIEGFEKEAISTLSTDDALPTFLSFELNSECRQIMSHLASLGYEAFQIVRQGKGHLAPPPNPSREGKYVAIDFRNKHSGCFGRDLSDTWDTMENLDARVLEISQQMKARKAQGDKPGWFDIHVRHKGATA